ncbi:MAG: hypothetical protein LBD10_07460 [Desulfobulbus sp.]|jgi:hypothetical protein|uniref:hypothetical protein n=1 Tax=Desulfobulbus sp. TaxID=895 RepID=UPI00284AF31B|nr:hypothetical protein [Desulfobulbus sp.]MDR2550015.1 hypothetical protein [Desulfobulbus sp.]
MAKKDDQQQPPGFPGDGRPKPQPEIALVRMERDPVYGEPTAAEVHPDEVANWQEHGWAIVE